MKQQALFSSKDNSKNIKVSSDAIFVWHFKEQILSFKRGPLPAGILIQCYQPNI